MRRRILGLLLLGVIASAGCAGFMGPREVRQQLGRADAPGYTIPEQQQRGRERYAITEDDYRIGPRGYIDRPSPTGR